MRRREQSLSRTERQRANDEARAAERAAEHVRDELPCGVAADEPEARVL